MKNFPYPIYEVGGSIRDELLGLKPKDFDYAVEAPSFDAMLSAIKGIGGRVFLSKPEFLTVRAELPEIDTADFVLCRKDGEYLDGRHPSAVFPGSIYDDLARRDFTCNAIARNLETGEIIDPFDGRQAISNRILASVGCTAQKFKEDALRAFRAIRFAVTKDMNISSPIRNVIDNLHENNFVNVSTERIREELMKMFTHSTDKALSLLVFGYGNLMGVAINRGIWFKPMIGSK